MAGSLYSLGPKPQGSPASQAPWCRGALPLLLWILGVSPLPSSWFLPPGFDLTRLLAQTHSHLLSPLQGPVRPLALGRWPAFLNKLPPASWSFSSASSWSVALPLAHLRASGSAMEWLLLSPVVSPLPLLTPLGGWLVGWPLSALISSCFSSSFSSCCSFPFFFSLCLLRVVWCPSGLCQVPCGCPCPTSQFGSGPWPPAQAFTPFVSGPCLLVAEPLPPPLPTSLFLLHPSLCPCPWAWRQASSFPFAAS